MASYASTLYNLAAQGASWVCSAAGKYSTEILTVATGTLLPLIASTVSTQVARLYEKHPTLLTLSCGAAAGACLVLFRRLFPDGSSTPTDSPAEPSIPSSSELPSYANPQTKSKQVFQLTKEENSQLQDEIESITNELSVNSCYKKNIEKHSIEELTGYESLCPRYPELRKKWKEWREAAFPSNKKPQSIKKTAFTDFVATLAKYVLIDRRRRK